MAPPRARLHVGTLALLGSRAAATALRAALAQLAQLLLLIGRQRRAELEHGGDVRLLVLAGKSLRRSDFARTLQEDLTPIGRVLADRCKKG